MRSWDWDSEEQTVMVAAYRRAHIARCPRDAAILTVTDALTLYFPDDDTHHPIVLTCPVCRRVCSSTFIEGQGGAAG